MPDVLIVNASPLIFLGKAGRIELLRTIGATRILVPETVFEEVAHCGHTDVAARALLGSDWIERTPAPVAPTSVIEWDLGAGESSVIATALRHPESSAVIDDLCGRRCAHALGVDVIGTLGVVIAAHRRGAIENPREVLLELRATGMWLSDAVIARALQLAGVET
jgi:predicted nucleic acid-binding protein